MFTIHSNILSIAYATQWVGLYVWNMLTHSQKLLQTKLFVLFPVAALDEPQNNAGGAAPSWKKRKKKKGRVGHDRGCGATEGMHHRICIGYPAWQCGGGEL